MRPGPFAASIAGRYGRAPRRFGGAAMVLLGSRRPGAPGRGAWVRHEHLHRALRVAIRVGHSTMVDRRSSVVRHEGARAAPFVDRLITRTVTRPAAVSPVIRRASPPARPPAPHPPVARVVRNRPPQPEPARAGPEAREDAPPVRAGFAAPTPVATSLPPLELARVTDHVLRSLDRKMSSWRDRRGRS